jgi:hypothetical protein
MDKPRDGRHEHCFAVAAGHGTKMIAMLSVEQQIVARSEQLRMMAPQLDEAVRDEYFLAPVSPIAAQFGESSRASFAQ